MVEFVSSQNIAILLDSGSIQVCQDVRLGRAGITKFTNGDSLSLNVSKHI